jgi:hypothetical protein
MKKKRIYALLLILIVILLVIIITKTEKSEDNSSNRLSETEIEEVSKSLDKEIDVGEFIASDIDSDGLYDRFVLELDSEEIGEDLVLNKTIEYNKTEQGFMGTLTLEFENTGDETKTYSHIEKIPKSFAANVNDLTFSIPPTEIINPDPEVSWEVEVMKRNIERIAINTKNAAISAAVRADPTRAMGMMLVGMGNVPSKEMIEACKDAVINVLLDNLADFVFTRALNDCSKLGGQGALWNTCIVNLMVKYPDMFVESDCEKIDIEQPDATNNIKGRVLHGLCKAITTKDWKECHENADSWKEVDICKLALFKSVSEECEYTEDKDSCIYDAAVETNSQYGCNGIDESVVKYQCLAEITQEIEHCEMIDDEDMKGTCCETISDDIERKECYGETEQKETVSCEDKSEGLFRDSCWRGQAVNNCDTDICIRNFEREYDINECIYDVASKCGIDYCLDMKESQTYYNRVSCIWALAKDEDDCVLIGDDEYESITSSNKKENQESCIERVKRN